MAPSISKEKIAPRPDNSYASRVNICTTPRGKRHAGVVGNIHLLRKAKLLAGILIAAHNFLPLFRQVSAQAFFDVFSEGPLTRDRSRQDAKHDHRHVFEKLLLLK